jgi:hypothetical protein
MNIKRLFPLGTRYENKESSQGLDSTRILVGQPYPDPEIRGTGIVKSKDGRIKHGSNTIKRGG